MSTTATLLTKTRETAARKKAETAAQYRDLVKAAAEGEDLDPDAVVEFLDEAGIEPATYAEAVELAAKRVEWKKLADTLPKLRAEQDANAAEAAAVTARLAAEIEAAQTKAALAHQPLVERRIKLDVLVREAERAESQLFSTADAAHPEHAERVKAAAAKVAAARERVGQTSGVLAKCNMAIELAPPDPRSFPGWGNAKDSDFTPRDGQERAQRAAAAEAAKEMLPEAQKADAEARTALAEAQRARELVEAEALKP
jgi:hypothetical protein